MRSGMQAKRQWAKPWRRLALAALLAAAGSGCVAVNVGKPTVYTRTDTIVTTNKTPLKTEVLSVEPRAEVDGNRLNAWLDADVREEYQRWQHEETVTVKKQRRLAMGISPGWARCFLVPKGAVEHCRWNANPFLQNGNYYPSTSWKKNYSWTNTNREGAVVVFQDSDGNAAGYIIVHTVGLAMTLGLVHAWNTVETLLVEPFSNRGWYEQPCGVWDLENVRQVNVTNTNNPLPNLSVIPCLDVSGSPKMKLLGRFSHEERMQMGIRTCFDANWDGGASKSPSCGLLGVSKYNDIFLDPVAVSPSRPADNIVARETRAVGGPYEVELRIAGTDVSGKLTVGAGSGKATFTLPQVEVGGRYEATLSFRSLYAGGDDAVRKAWNTRALKQWVWLQEKPKLAAPAAQAPAREVVKEIHHYHETRVVEERKAEGPPYNVEKSADGTGRTVWRVKILAETQNAFTVDREVKAQILQELRDDFAGRNPHVPRGEINAFATYTTEDGGRTLVYVGVAESLIPSLESLTYSAETHRGTVTMRLAGGADLPRSKEFVRNNISAIVCDKNVVLTAGERPPDGAKYRSLDENFADGVLTVEFEAVEEGGRGGAW